MIGMRESAMPGAFIVDRLDEVLSMVEPDLHERIVSGHVSPTPYDTAWTARIRDPDGNPQFPGTIDWLLANQRADGSWGSNVYHAYDRFINTLSAAIALKELGIHPERVAMAEAYLTRAIDGLEGNDEALASDHLVSMLIDEARRVGLAIPYERSPHRPYHPVKRLMLSYVYADPDHPLGFFSELLGRLPNNKRISRKLQMENGSISSAAAATAASIVFDPDPVMDHSYYNKLRYLSEMMTPEGGVRHFWDYEVMERIYGLYHLMYAQPRTKTFVASAKRIEESWRQWGLSFGNHFEVPDLDNTAMGYTVLTHVGHEPPSSVFDGYWKGEFFSTYRVHNKGHEGPNIHALEAVARSSHPNKDELIDKTVRFLRGVMVDGNHFGDHWHTSPAYPTSHAIRAFHLTEEALMERCVSFFLDTQQDDGSWGYIDNGNGLGTLEETAFALQGLLYYHQQVASIDIAPIHHGIEYILERYPTVSYPELWVAKVLFAPKNIIEALIIGALMMYRNSSGTGFHGRGSVGGGEI